MYIYSTPLAIKYPNLKNRSENIVKKINRSENIFFLGMSSGAKSGKTMLSDSRTWQSQVVPDMILTKEREREPQNKKRLGQGHQFLIWKP